MTTEFVGGFPVFAISSPQNTDYEPIESWKFLAITPGSPVNHACRSPWTGHFVDSMPDRDP
jgi:hypothetical protein